jgi:hypothetical protein
MQEGSKKCFEKTFPRICDHGRGVELSNPVL